MGNNMNCRSCSQQSRNANPTSREPNIPPRHVRKEEIPNDVSCKELMKALMEADFMAQDLKLYLDTHPDDMRALDMYREAVRQYKACKAAFEDTFYPLTADSAGRNGSWDWLDGTFPPWS